MKNNFENWFSMWFSEWFEEHYGDDSRKMKDHHDDAKNDVKSEEVDGEMLYKKIGVCRDAALSLETSFQELSDLAADCDGDLAKKISIAACLSTYSIKDLLKEFNKTAYDFEKEYQKMSVQV